MKYPPTKKKKKNTREELTLRSFSWENFNVIYSNADPLFHNVATTKLKQVATSIMPAGGSDRNAFSLAAFILFTGTFMKRYDTRLIKKTQRVALGTTKHHQEKTAGEIVKEAGW